jgi:O-antigen/teichoic acid export membrane protein
VITKRFIKSSIIYTIAGSLPMASAIILLPFYLGYLSASNFGVLSVFTGISALIQVFVTYSFDTAIYSYYHDYKNDPKKLAAFVTSIFIFILILGGAVCVLSTLTGPLVYGLFFAKVKISFYPYGLLSVITGIFQSVFKVFSNLLQAQEKADRFLRSNLFLFTTIALFTILGLYFFPDDLLGPIGGRMLALTISTVWVITRVYLQFGFQFDKAIIKKMLGFNQPILLYQILQWANVYYDRLLMSRYLPLSSVGVYDLAVKCLMALEFIVAGFNSSFLPRVLGAIALQRKKKTTVEINRYYNGLTAVSIILVALSIFTLPLIVEWMVQWFHKPDYLKAVPLIPWVATGYLFRSMRLYVAMPYAALKNSRPLPIYYSVVIGLKIGMMVWLMNLYGIPGVIYSAWIGYLVEVLILYWGIENKFEFKFNTTKLVIAPVLFGILIVAVEPLLGIRFPYLAHTIYLVVAAIVLFWAYRNELRTLEWNKILK